MSLKTGGRAEHQAASCQEPDTSAGFLVVLREFPGLLGMTAKSGAGRGGAGQFATALETRSLRIISWAKWR